MSVMVQAFADEAAPAGRLADALGAPLGVIDLHTFPDGESLSVVPACPSTVIVYRSLDRPDAKLMPLFLAADAWRRGGVKRLVLVAPYLCYLRQDAVFAPGQPLSQAVVGDLLGARFDAIVTVDPHLHRNHDLSPVFGGKPIECVSAAPALAAALRDRDPAHVVVGPDSESEPWGRRIASALGAAHVVLEKVRRGDRSVDVALREPGAVRGRRLLLVDDVCSSGGTLISAAGKLLEAGATQIDVAITHALFDQMTDARLRRAGVAHIVSTDSCPHSTNAAWLAPWLADAVAPLLGPSPGDEDAHKASRLAT